MGCCHFYLLFVFLNHGTWVRLFCNFLIFFLSAFGCPIFRERFSYSLSLCDIEITYFLKVRGFSASSRTGVCLGLRGEHCCSNVFGDFSPQFLLEKKLNFLKSWKNGTMSPWIPFPFLSIYHVLTFYHLLISMCVRRHWGWVSGCITVHIQISPKQWGFCCSSQGPRMAFGYFASSVCFFFFVTLTWNRWAIDFIEAHSGFIWWFPLV